MNVSARGERIELKQEPAKQLLLLSGYGRRNHVHGNFRHELCICSAEGKVEATFTNNGSMGKAVPANQVKEFIDQRLGARRLSAFPKVARTLNF